MAKIHDLDIRTAAMAAIYDMIQAFFESKQIRSTRLLEVSTQGNEDTKLNKDVWIIRFLDSEDNFLFEGIFLVDAYHPEQVKILACTMDASRSYCDAYFTKTHFSVIYTEMSDGAVFERRYSLHTEGTFAKYDNNKSYFDHRPIVVIDDLNVAWCLRQIYSARTLEDAGELVSEQMMSWENKPLLTRSVGYTISNPIRTDKFEVGILHLNFQGSNSNHERLLAVVMVNDKGMEILHCTAYQDRGFGSLEVEFPYILFHLYDHMDGETFYFRYDIDSGILKYHDEWSDSAEYRPARSLRVASPVVAWQHYLDFVESQKRKSKQVNW